MDKKQALLLSLLAADEDGTISGRTRLQKLLFLAQEDFSEPLDTGYEFYAYDYGPFSKELLDDIESLERDGLVSERNIDLGHGEKYIYEIEPDGQAALERFLEGLTEPERAEIIDRAELVESNFNGIALSRLLEFVYNQYESYTEESVL